MKNTILLLSFFLITECIPAQQTSSGNVGIGTNSPLEKLHIAGGNVLIEDGVVARSSTGARKDLLPIAIASISSAGIVADGTINVSCTRNGFDYLVDIGEKNSNCQVFISLHSGNARSYQISKMTGSDDTKFRIKLLSSTNQQTESPFSLIVFKAGNDPLHEYNITISTNANGIRIGHGYFGIDAYGVDSVTINITILSNVIIGGPDPDTASSYSGAINIVDIPCPAKITITNFGEIIGRGGRGGKGGSTYQSNSPLTNTCGGISITDGSPGGDAIQTSKKITVINHGFIAGGGGGGGGGKAGAVSGANGGGGGTGAGWPLVPGGQGGGTYYGTSGLSSCPPGGQLPGCGSQACCCGRYAPFGNNGAGNAHLSNGNQYLGGSGATGVNGGFFGHFGGGLASPGASNTNTGAGGTPGKVIRKTASGGTGNTVTNMSGGSFTGVVD